jgi:hypothetical protein
LAFKNLIHAVTASGEQQSTHTQCAKGVPIGFGGAHVITQYGGDDDKKGKSEFKQHADVFPHALLGWGS